MGIRIKRSSSKYSYMGFRPNFYGQYKSRHNTTTEVKLETKIKGVPPASGKLSDAGDDEFEKSKSVAEFEFKNFLETKRDAKTATAKYAQTVRESTGRTVKDIPIAMLPKLSKASKPEYAHENKTQSDWDNWNQKIVKDFADWASLNGFKSVYSITQEAANSYCVGIAKTKSKDTLKHVVNKLKSTFKSVVPYMSNPFENSYKFSSAAMTKDSETIHREPISEKEMLMLWNAAKEHGGSAYELSVLASCTGLRIGDVCNLEWRSVDLENNVLFDVYNSKTKAFVTIPIFDYDETSDFFHPIMGEMRKVLETVDATTRQSGETFVIPKAHDLYKKNRDAVYTLGKILFAEVLVQRDSKEVTARDTDPESITIAITSSSWSESKKTRISKCYELFRSGLSYDEIVKEMGYPAKNRVSMDLSEVEKISGSQIRPLSKAGKDKCIRHLVAKTRMARSNGKRSASLYGWHSLRHSFVVMAVNAGVPIDIVRQIVGHTTVEMTKSYFNPTAKIAAENMRRIMSEKKRNANNARQQDALSVIINALPEEEKQKILQQAALALAMVKTPQLHPTT